MLKKMAGLFTVIILLASMIPTTVLAGGAAHSFSFNYDDVQIYETNAYIHAKVSNPERLTVTTVGCNIWDANNNLLLNHIENCKRSESRFNMWYDFNEELNLTLTPGTVYQYQYFVKYDGTWYNGTVQSFTTNGTAPSVTETEDYIIADSDTRVVTEDELKCFTAEELRLARNEIYARYGRIFKSADLDNYFRSKNWYRPTVEADKFDESILNTIEKGNIKTIYDYEQTMKSQTTSASVSNTDEGMEEIYSLLVGTWVNDESPKSPDIIEIKRSGDGLVYSYYGIRPGNASGMGRNKTHTTWEYQDGKIRVNSDGTINCYCENNQEKVYERFSYSRSTGELTELDSNDMFHRDDNYVYPGK